MGIPLEAPLQCRSLRRPPRDAPLFHPHDPRAPRTGFGLGAWPIACPRFALYDDGETVNQAHNDWAQWTTEGGIPFLATLLAMAIPAVRAAPRSLWGVGLLAVMAHACVDFPFQQRPALGACFFALLGALAVTVKELPAKAGRFLLD